MDSTRFRQYVLPKVREYAAADRTRLAAELELLEEGETVLDLYVTEAGLVEAAQARKSSGFPVLDTAALNAAGTWELVPGEVDGKATCMWGTFATNFKLTK